MKFISYNKVTKSYYITCVNINYIQTYLIKFYKSLFKLTKKFINENILFKSTMIKSMSIF